MKGKKLPHKDDVAAKKLWAHHLMASKMLPETIIAAKGKKAVLLGGHQAETNAIQVRCLCDDLCEHEKNESPVYTLESWLEHCTGEEIDPAIDDINGFCLTNVIVEKYIGEDVGDLTLRDLCRQTADQQGGEALIGRPVVVYWVDQHHTDQALDEMERTWYKGTFTEGVGTWFGAKVSGYKPSTGIITITYNMDDGYDEILLPITLMHWGEKPPHHGPRSWAQLQALPIPGVKKKKQKRSGTAETEATVDSAAKGTFKRAASGVSAGDEDQDNTPLMQLRSGRISMIATPEATSSADSLLTAPPSAPSSSDRLQNGKKKQKQDKRQDEKQQEKQDENKEQGKHDKPLDKLKEDSKQEEKQEKALMAPFLVESISGILDADPPAWRGGEKSEPDHKSAQGVQPPSPGASLAQKLEVDAMAPRKPAAENAPPASSSTFISQQVPQTHRVGLPPLGSGSLHTPFSGTGRGGEPSPSCGFGGWGQAPTNVYQAPTVHELTQDPEQKHRQQRNFHLHRCGNIARVSFLQLDNSLSLSQVKEYLTKPIPGDIYRRVDIQLLVEIGKARAAKRHSFGVIPREKAFAAKEATSDGKPITYAPPESVLPGLPKSYSYLQLVLDALKMHQFESYNKEACSPIMVLSHNRPLGNKLGFTYTSFLAPAPHQQGVQEVPEYDPFRFQMSLVMPGSAGDDTNAEQSGAHSFGPPVPPRFYSDKMPSKYQRHSFSHGLWQLQIFVGDATWRTFVRVVLDNAMWLYDMRYTIACALQIGACTAELLGCENPQQAQERAQKLLSCMQQCEALIGSQAQMEMAKDRKRLQLGIS